jgi:hypothetical protein
MPARLLAFNLVMAAAESRHGLDGENQVPKVIGGFTFRDGVGGT